MKQRNQGAIVLNVITFLFALFLLAFLYEPGQNNDPRYAPVENPHPQYFMTVTGHIDPALRQRLNLQLLATYMNYNPECDYVVGLGANTYRQRGIVVSVNPDAQGNYQVQLPLDKYLPGRCQWGALSFDFTIQNTQIGAMGLSESGSSAGLAFFTNESQLPPHFRPAPTINISFDQHLAWHYEKYEWYNGHVPQRRNYLFHLNLYAKENACLN